MGFTNIQNINTSIKDGNLESVTFMSKGVDYKYIMYDNKFINKELFDNVSNLKTYLDININSIINSLLENHDSVLDSLCDMADSLSEDDNIKAQDIIDNIYILISGNSAVLTSCKI